MDYELHVILDEHLEIILGTVVAASEHDALCQAMSRPREAFFDTKPERLPIEARHAVDLADGRWREVAPTGPQPGGDVNPDVQLSDAVCRRWALRRRDGLWALYAATFYVAKVNMYDDSDDAEATLECQGEYLICRDLRDPGGTEEYGGDYRYERVAGVPTYEAAVAACRAMTTGDVTWTGQEIHGFEIPRRSR